ncbi:TPA: DUF1270 family protein, partial [Staphylococcus aureus]|nr:DUF1270 family protein [Staphylococcus aureus]
MKQPKRRKKKMSDTYKSYLVAVLC